MSVVIMYDSASASGLLPFRNLIVIPGCHVLIRLDHSRTDNNGSDFNLGISARTGQGFALLV